MPNWCLNQVEIVSDDSALLERLKEAFVADKVGETFGPPNPNPDAWYAFNVENWGTKWDFGDTEAHISGDTLFASFETAWSPPVALMQYICDNNDVFIRLRYYEPGMNFIGEWHSVWGEEYYDDVDEAPQEMRDDWGIEDWEEDDEGATEV